MRSSTKPPYVPSHIQEKVKKQKSSKKKKTIKVWARATTIIPSMIGITFGVYNGRQHIPVFITGEMVGHKLGEFSPTRKFISHWKKDRKRKKRKLKQGNGN